jgi:hypothetical protein
VTDAKGNFTNVNTALQKSRSVKKSSAQTAQPIWLTANNQITSKPLSKANFFSFKLLKMSIICWECTYQFVFL